MTNDDITLAATPPAESGMGEAWRVAEAAALARGAEIEGLMRVDTSDDPDLTIRLIDWEAEASFQPLRPSVCGLGATPVAALLDLAARLSAVASAVGPDDKPAE